MKLRKKRARSHESKIYCELSHLYEPIFTKMLGPRIRSTIASLEISPGARVLEVGVGTGLSLAAYPADVAVTAIDIAPEMLARARRKIDRHAWRHIRLLQMDALDMDLPDEHFDYVMAFHIVSVVPDFERLIREILRVTKPGGTVVIINHFRSEHKWLAPLVDMLDPITRRLGWRTTLRLGDVIDSSRLRVEQRFKTSRRSLFTVVVAVKPGASRGAVPQPEVLSPSAEGSPTYAPPRTVRTCADLATTPAVRPHRRQR